MRYANYFIQTKSFERNNGQSSEHAETDEDDDSDQFSYFF